MLFFLTLPSGPGAIWQVVYIPMIFVACVLIYWRSLSIGWCNLIHRNPAGQQVLDGLYVVCKELPKGMPSISTGVPSDAPMCVCVYLFMTVLTWSHVTEYQRRRCRRSSCTHLELHRGKQIFSGLLFDYGHQGFTTNYFTRSQLSKWTKYLLHLVAIIVAVQSQHVHWQQQ